MRGSFPAEELSNLLSEPGPDSLPTSQLELEALLANELERCTETQRELFATRRVLPYAVPIRRLGAIEEAYVVAVFGLCVLYYEDVEEGFELAQLDAEGMIPEHRCNQFDLTHILAQLELDTETSWHGTVPHHPVMPATRRFP